MLQQMHKKGFVV